MMRFTTIVIAFLLIIQSLEEEHVLAHAHEGGEAGHKNLDYRGDQDSSTLHPQVVYDVAPRKLRSGRTVRAEKKQVMAVNDNWSFKMSASSKHLRVGRKLGFHKRSKSSSLKWKPKKKKSSSPFVAFYEDYHGPARHPPRHNL